LIEPNIVLIGSANFTCVGASLVRDTLAVIEDKGLYEQYFSHVETLKANSLVMDSASADFESYFLTYCKNYKRTQSALLSSTEKTDVHTWLSNDVNQTVPLFIWDRDIESSEYESAYSLIEDKEPEVTSKDSYRLSTYGCAQNDLPYFEGDVVITMNKKGAHIRFEKIDRIIYKDGVHYLYSFKNKRFNKPFDIKEIYDGLKSIAADLYEKEQTVLLREDIKGIAK